MPFFFAPASRDRSAMPIPNPKYRVPPPAAPVLVENPLPPAVAAPPPPALPRTACRRRAAAARRTRCVSAAGFRFVILGGNAARRPSRHVSPEVSPRETHVTIVGCRWMEPADAASFGTAAVAAGFCWLLLLNCVLSVFFPSIPVGRLKAPKLLIRYVYVYLWRSLVSPLLVSTRHDSAAKPQGGELRRPRSYGVCGAAAAAQSPVRR